jgi:hypothetical protein
MGWFWKIFFSRKQDLVLCRHFHAFVCNKQMGKTTQTHFLVDALVQISEDGLCLGREFSSALINSFRRNWIVWMKTPGI